MLHPKMIWILYDEVGISPARSKSAAGNLENFMLNCAGDDTVSPQEPVVLSLRTDKAGRCVLSSSDGRIGGTFINRQLALREVDDRICMSGHVTVIVIEPKESAR